MMGYRQIRFNNLNPDDRMMVFGSGQISLCRELAGADARRWLTETRGLDVQTISDFRLGYVPLNVDHAFAGRIVIPIFDSYGKLLALSVRPATNDEAILDEYKKYWNESYEKGWNLFGLNLARLSIIKKGFVILVEGQFDVMAMHSYGFTNTVGVLGGAFTPMQAQLLKLWTDQIVLMFDGDTPGKNHALRCLEVLSYYGFVPKGQGRAFLPRIDKRTEKDLDPAQFGVRNFQSVLRATKVTLRDGMDPNDYLKRLGSYPMRREIIDSMKTSNMRLPKEWE